MLPLDVIRIGEWQIERVVLCCFSQKDYDKYLELAPTVFPPHDVFEQHAEK